MTMTAHLGKLLYVRHTEISSGKNKHASAPNPWADSIGRIPVVDVSPTIEQGRWPAKAVVGEPVPIQATVFREGHDAVAATAVLIDPDGEGQDRQTAGSGR